MFTILFILIALFHFAVCLVDFLRAEKGSEKRAEEKRSLIYSVIVLFVGLSVIAAIVLGFGLLMEGAVNNM